MLARLRPALPHSVQPFDRLEATHTMQEENALYFDHNATAPLHPEVLEAMLPFLTTHHGNSLSGHAFGRVCAEALKKARAQVADLIGARPSEIVFNSGGSEALNHAIKGLAFTWKKGARRILFSSTEHHAVEDSIRWLERFNFIAEPLPVNGAGQITPETLERALLSGPAFLVAVMWANNEVGTLQPIQELTAIAQREGVRFLCDAVQAAGKVPISVENIDLMALAGHKLYGPKGIGALYIREGLVLEPLIHGASHENGRRAGTHAVALAVGMGAAAELAQRQLNKEMFRQASLRSHLERRLLQEIPHTFVHGQGAPRLPNTCCVSFEGVMAWELQTTLDRLGAAISAGAACRSGQPKPSPVLTAMGVDGKLALGGVRLSLGRHSALADVDRLVDALVDAVTELRVNRHKNWLTPARG